jgi:hypothetical protein
MAQQASHTNGGSGALAQALSAARGDPKKTGVMAVLAVLLAFMVWRTFGPGATPSRASASQAGQIAARARAGAGGALGSIAAGGSGNSAADSQAARDLAISPYLRKWADAPVSTISRNLFAVRLEYFPMDGPKTGSNDVRERGDDGFWARLEKSLVVQADQRDKRENQKANYIKAAAELKLQSTMMGAQQPKALVNGELVGEGDVVADFRVVKIEARRVIVEREGIRLEIQMK